MAAPSNALGRRNQRLLSFTYHTVQTAAKPGRHGTTGFQAASGGRSGLRFGSLVAVVRFRAAVFEEPIGDQAGVLHSLPAYHGLFVAAAVLTVMMAVYVIGAPLGSHYVVSQGLSAFDPSEVATQLHRDAALRDIQNFIHVSMPEWKKQYPGVETLNVAVMGCIVNGPGESKHADIGISLPGTGESPAAPVFIDGKKAVTLRGPTVAADFKQMVIDYIDRRFGTSGAGRTAAE